MPDYQHITAENRGSAVVITVLPEHIKDPDVCHGLKDEMVAASTAAGAAHVIIDVGRVEFLGSMGLLGFLALRRVPGVENIVLCRVTPYIKEMLLLCRLVSEEPDRPSTFGLANSVDDAIAGVGQ